MITKKRTVMQKIYTDKKSVRFPEDNVDLVRVLKKSRKDFDALARCYNSFKDPDSWPEGFGGTLNFTGEYLEKEMKDQDTNSYFVAVDPKNREKIIGVSFVNPTWNVSNGYYVLLLGVDPAYQRKGYGKALLLRSTQYAADKNAQLITLHTWGGNVKAQPVYKRQGYKWRPKTSAYMENYLPQILNYPLIQTFFQNLKSNWYNVFKPVITQEPNLEFEEKMAVYEYLFEEADQSLNVWVDRTIGKINGFHLKTPENVDLYIKAKTPNSEAFIGFEEFPITLEMKNNGEISHDISIEVITSPQIKIRDYKEKYSLKLEAQTEETLEFIGSFLSNTAELDMSEHTHTFSDHMITFSITMNEVEFPINVGKCPVNAIKVQTLPQNFVTIPNYTVKVPLSLQNYMGDEQNVVVDVKDGTFIKFEKHQQQAKISTYDTTLNFVTRIEDTSTTVDEFEVEIRNLEGKLLSTSKIPIIIFKESKTVSYELEQQIFAENKHVRVSLYKKSQPGNNEVIIIDKTRRLKIKGHGPVLGYPFDHEGSEFFTLEMEHEIEENRQGLFLKSSALSKKKPGVRVIRKIVIPNDAEPIVFFWTVENTSSESKENLGIQSSTYCWPQEMAYRTRVFPLQEGIIHLDFFGFSIDMGKDPSEFTEGWQASEFSGGWIGCLFDPEKIDKIDIGRFFPIIDHKIPTLKPGESYTVSPVWYTFADSWQQIKKTWEDVYIQSPSNKLKPFLESKSHAKFGLLDGELVCQSLFLDIKQQEIEVGFDAFRKTTPKAKFQLKIDNLNTNVKIDVPEVETRIWKEKIRIPIPNQTKPISGLLAFDSLTRIHKLPISLAFYDDSMEVEIARNESANYIEVSNGFLTYRASEQYRGQIFYLSLEESENYLLTFFPEIKPFLWFNEFYGGIGTILRPAFTWEVEDYNKLKFTSYEVKQGLWSGVGFQSEIIEYSPKIKGLQVATNFLTLPKSPVLLVHQILTNHSGVERDFNINLQASFKTSNTNKDRYYVRSSNEIATYQLQEWESRVWLERDPLSKWTAFHRAGNKYITAAILPFRQFSEHVAPYAPNLSIAYLNMNGNGLTIQLKKNLNFYTLFLFTDNLKTIEPFTSSNLLNFLPK